VLHDACRAGPGLPRPFANILADLGLPYGNEFMHEILRGERTLFFGILDSCRWGVFCIVDSKRSTIKIVLTLWISILAIALELVGRALSACIHEELVRANSPDLGKACICRVTTGALRNGK